MARAILKKLWKCSLLALACCMCVLACTQKALADNNVQQYMPQDNSFLYSVDIADLAQSNTNYDNKVVEVSGEVIGDQVSAEDDPDYCWITLTSLDINTDTVAVYMSRSDAQQIDEFGKYGTHGTTLKVRGTYHVGCQQHNGITCLHASTVTGTEAGYQTPEEFDFWIFLPGFFAVGIGFLLFALYKRISTNVKQNRK